MHLILRRVVGAPSPGDICSKPYFGVTFVGSSLDVVCAFLDRCVRIGVIKQKEQIHETNKRQKDKTTLGGKFRKY